MSDETITLATLFAMLEGGGFVKQLQDALSGDTLAVSQLTFRLAQLDSVLTCQASN